MVSTAIYIRFMYLSSLAELILYPIFTPEFSTTLEWCVFGIRYAIIASLMCFTVACIFSQNRRVIFNSYVALYVASFLLLNYLVLYAEHESLAFILDFALGWFHILSIKFSKFIDAMNLAVKPPYNPVLNTFDYRVGESPPNTPAISEGCSICLENFKDADRAVITNCRHTFHETCIRSWLQYNPTCPICRSAV